jgi:hypothetical protein
VFGEKGDGVVLFREFAAAGERVDLGDLVLPEPRPMRFVVADADGRPIAGAEARFHASSEWPQALCTTSRSDGTFERAIAAGVPLRVVFRRSGFATRIVPVTADTPQPVRVVLGPRGAVRVRARVPAGPRGHAVEMQLPGGRGLWLWLPSVGDDTTNALSSPEGALFADLPPGPVDVALVASSRRTVRTVEVVAGATVDCDFGE